MQIGSTYIFKYKCILHMQIPNFLFYYVGQMRRRFKGDLISESFFFILAQISKSEKLSEIKPPLEENYLGVEGK